jgi:hypothetical protein
MHKQDSIWLYDSGNMTPLFVRGEHPPGTPAGVTYDVFGFSPALNEAGQVLTASCWPAVVSMRVMNSPSTYRMPRATKS